MPPRVSLNVSLTPELERFVEERVSTGRYQTASEVVREGLRLLERQEQMSAPHSGALKQRLRRSAIQAERGEHVDPEETLKKIKALKRRRASSKS